MKTRDTQAKLDILISKAKELKPGPRLRSQIWPLINLKGEVDLTNLKAYPDWREVDFVSDPSAKWLAPYDTRMRCFGEHKGKRKRYVFYYNTGSISKILAHMKEHNLRYERIQFHPVVKIDALTYNLCHEMLSALYQ